MNRILVIGSSGSAGGGVVEELVRAGRPVRAATRFPGRLQAPAGVEPVRFDFADPGTYAPALDGVDGVFLNPPPVPDPHRAMLPFTQAAAREGRKIVLQTQMGAEFQPEHYSEREVELLVERSGVPWVILRPNWFMDNFHTYWHQPIQQAGVIPLPAADARTSLIDARDIGAAAAAAFRTSAFDGRAFTLTGPEALTYAQAAAVLSEATGREIRYIPMDGEAFVQSLVTAGVPEAVARYLALLFEFVRQGAAEPVSPAVEELTGRPARTLAEYARDRAAAWALTGGAGR